MFVAFAYEENSHKKIYECYGRTKEDAVNLFRCRVDGQKIPCMVYEVDTITCKPVGRLEIF